MIYLHFNLNLLSMLKELNRNLLWGIKCVYFYNFNYCLLGMDLSV